MNPNSSKNKQVNLLQLKTKTWIDNIGNSHLPKYHKILRLQVRLKAQLSYPLVFIHLTSQQYEMISKPFLRVVRSIFNLPVSFPKALLHLNQQFGG